MPAASPVAPHPRRRANTRARLLASALDVFAEQGLKRVTVDDLVQAAGFTRGAFYSNFSSIEEVFFAVFENQAERMLTAVREAIASVPEGEFTLDSVGLVLESLRPYGRQWYLVQTEFALLALRNEEARAVYDEHNRRFQGELVDAVGEVITRLGRTPTIPLEQLAEVALALYVHTLGQEHLGTGALGTDELVESVLPRLILGLSEPLA